MPSSTLLTNARLFDGEKVLAERGFIFFNDSGLITDIGTDFSAIPPADTVIDASGNTVLPGLIDGHVHVHDGVSELAQAIKFGVTTVLDLFNEPDVISKLKNAASERVDIADVKSSCLAATIKDGWPRPVVLATLENKEEALRRMANWPELETPDQAEAFVADMKAKGADYIKLMHESGAGLLSDPLPLPSHELQSALVQAAHKHGLITLAHALTQKDTLAILAAGTDALAHSFCDEPPGEELLAAYRRNNSFLIPTLAVSATLTGGEREMTEHFIKHPLANKVLDDKAKTCYCGRMMMAKAGNKPEFSYQMVEMLHEGGIDIVAGTDTATGLLGTSMGISLHQELSLYVDRCGLTPIEALRSATSTTARRFRLDDRGILARGRRTDILMVKGDPTKNISLTLEIGGIWRGGVALSPEDGVQSASLENLSGPVVKPGLTELGKGVSKEVMVSHTHVLPDVE